MIQRLILLILLSGFGAGTLASSPQIIRAENQSDFADGKITALRIDSRGAVSLGYELETSDELDVSSVWRLLPMPDGSILAGAGNEGKLLKSSTSQDWNILFDSPEIAIVSLALMSRNTVLAGTAPDGLIYKIQLGKTPEIFASTGQHYVWDIVLDPSGTIYAATGDDAKILKYSSNGTLQKTFDLNSDHARRMVWTDNGLWVGTADPAVIYRVYNDDLQAVFEAKEREINCLTAGTNSEIYFAAVASPAISGTEIRPGMALSPNISGATGNEKSTVYRIDSNHTVLPWWSTTAVPVFDMTMFNGKPVVACGGNGYIYAIEGPDAATLLHSNSESPAICLQSHDNRLIIGSASPAHVLMSTGKTATSGQLETTVFDAGTVTTWGTLNINPVDYGTITIQTRSGNREEPCNLWSDWQALSNRNEMLHISSPPARFLQFQVAFKADNKQRSPKLEYIEFTCQSPNQYPGIANVIVHPVTKGVFIDQPGGNGKLYRQTLSDGSTIMYNLKNRNATQGIGKGEWFTLKGMRTIQWWAHDPDRDSLVFKAELSDKQSDQWIQLADEITNPLYSFDSTAFPDGEYIVRIHACDSPSNPEGLSLTTHFTSRTFTIDNSVPEIRAFSAVIPQNASETCVISGSVLDKFSRILSLEYSFDAEKWHSFVSEDGMVDSRMESFNQTVPRPKNVQKVFLRVTDSQENTNTALTKPAFH